MHAFDVLGDPVRRRILELLADGELTAGAITATIRGEFGISQPAVSQHLRVLRESGFAVVRADGARRLYAVAPAPLREVDAWLERFRGFWSQHLASTEPATDLHDHAASLTTLSGRWLMGRVWGLVLPVHAQGSRLWVASHPPNWE